jgi:hypothetical protein
MIIGNIITSSKIDDENIKVCRKIETIKPNLPVLIVGWGKTKELYENASIIKKQIDENTFWTFSPKERKVDYDKDLEKFIKLCYENIVKDTKYYYVDFIHSSKKIIYKVLRKIYNSEKIITYLYNDRMLYIYTDNIIFGVDLDIVEYIGIKKEKVIKKLKSISCDFLTNDEIFIKYKNLLKNIDNKYRYIPYIYDIDKNE